jgi:hypothetical protein
MKHLHSIEEKYTKRGVVCQRNRREPKGRRGRITAKSAKGEEEIEPQRRQDAMGGTNQLMTSPPFHTSANDRSA